MRAVAGDALRGEAAVPGDKSVSHRALILGALAVGETRITGLLEGQDVLDTAAAMRAFGAGVERTGPGAWEVAGVGVGGFAEPQDVIDCGNSGTGVRLIMGAMATTPITATFTGDASLRRRPMGRVTEPLALFGARAWGRAGGRLPMTVAGAAEPVPVRYALPVASAQVKSAVLLAGLNAPGETVVIEPEATRDHTERMLAGFGATLRVEEGPGGRAIVLSGQPELRPQRVAVPRDPSSAAFPVAAALMVPGSAVRVPGVSRNPTRDGFYVTLLEMGADLVFENPREEGGEPVAARPRRQHDRRIPRAGRACGLCRGPDGDARHPRAAGEGKRPDRRHGARARGLRRSAPGGRGQPDRPWRRPRGGGGRGGRRRPPRPPHRDGLPVPRPGCPRGGNGGRRRADRHELSRLPAADARTRGRDRAVNGTRPGRASFTVAVDGPAAAGKGTIARAIAARFGLAHLDTGLLYRAVGLRAAAGEEPEAAARALAAADLDRPGLRGEAAAGWASRVAAIPAVRAALLDFQRTFARRPGGAVLDGRDIGTVVCPEAEVKLFVTASPEVRARRRWLEQGGEAAAVLAEVQTRDARDAGRADAPLRAAPDAVVIDTSAMDAEAAVAAAAAVVAARLPPG
jgi:3-phosphoshikimate 1-carboxyvinyltransferase